MVLDVLSEEVVVSELSELPEVLLPAVLIPVAAAEELLPDELLPDELLPELFVISVSASTFTLLTVPAHVAVMVCVSNKPVSVVSAS